MLSETPTRTMKFVLNGEEVPDPLKELIHSEDTLLVSFGNEDSATLQKEYSEIPEDAGEYNEKYDPASCGGTNENGVLVLIQNFFDGLSHHHEE